LNIYESSKNDTKIFTNVLKYKFHILFDLRQFGYSRISKAILPWQDEGIFCSFCLAAHLLEICRDNKHLLKMTHRSYIITFMYTKHEINQRRCVVVDQDCLQFNYHVVSCSNRYELFIWYQTVQIGYTVKQSQQFIQIKQFRTVTVWRSYTSKSFSRSSEAMC
jgi:hypothetical protein